MFAFSLLIIRAQLDELRILVLQGGEQSTAITQQILVVPMSRPAMIMFMHSDGRFLDERFSIKPGLGNKLHCVEIQGHKVSIFRLSAAKGTVVQVDVTAA